jgi:hypothetical protein
MHELVWVGCWLHRNWRRQNWLWQQLLLLLLLLLLSKQKGSLHRDYCWNLLWIQSKPRLWSHSSLQVWGTAP